MAARARAVPAACRHSAAQGSFREGRGQIRLPAAYGFRIVGLESTPWLALEQAGDLPALHVNGLAQLGAAAVHPELARVALPAARARNRVALHCGTVLDRDGAWGLIGTNRSGKTTLLWTCMRLGLGIAADDVLVVEDGFAYAGPRCLDLRDPAPGSTGVRGDRHRVTLEPVPAKAQLRGFVHLRWDDRAQRPSIRALSGSEHVQRLLDPSRGDMPWLTPEAVLDLAGLPGRELARPRDGNVADAARALMTVLNT